MNKYLLAIGLLLIVIIIAFRVKLKFSFPLVTNTMSSDPKIDEIKLLNKYIIQKINSDGAEATLIELKTRFSDKNYAYKHAVSHLFGELIFEKLGVAGVSVCDDYYGYGCYHGFFTKAIDKNGEKIVKEMNDGCLAKTGKDAQACLHGIGHGLFEVYKEARLTEALDICKKSTHQLELFGCTSGIFMAYFFPIVTDENRLTFTLRKEDKNGLYHPCPSLPKQYQPVCYYEISQWWDYVFNHDFAKVGDLCQKIEDEYDRLICFRGIGHAVTLSVILAPKYEFNNLVAYCGKMPDREAEKLCRMESVRSFLSSYHSKEETEKLCEGLGDDFYKECRENIGLNM